MATPVTPPFRALGGAVPWVLSGPSNDDVRTRARRLRVRVDTSPRSPVTEIGGQLAPTGNDHPHRAVVVARDLAGFTTGLDVLADGGRLQGLVTGAGPGGDVLFVFPGQGCQWEGMAQELLESSPVFAERARECAEAIAPLAGWSPLDVLRGAPGARALKGPDVVQPTLFTVMVSLAALWRACGIEPAGVLGHSLGEIAAACVADALSLEDAARVVTLWSTAQATLSGRGDMVFVMLEEDEVRARLPQWGGRLVVAAVNGPDAVVVSGDVDAADELLEQLAAEEVYARRADVGLAAHSPQIDLIVPRLLSDLAPIRPRPPSVPMYSALTGGDLGGMPLDAEYWARSLREVVRFDEAVRAALEDGAGVLLEVSPHPVLAGAMAETVRRSGAVAAVADTLRRGDHGVDRFVLALGELHALGADPDWVGIFAAGA